MPASQEQLSGTSYMQPLVSPWRERNSFRELALQTLSRGLPGASQVSAISPQALHLPSCVAEVGWVGGSGWGATRRGTC